MTAAELAALAYRGVRMLDGLTTLEVAQYWMLFRIYEHFRAGKLPKADGETLKALVLGYEQLPKDERRLLLDAFLKSWNEDPQAHFAAVKAVSKLYLEENL